MTVRSSIVSFLRGPARKAGETVKLTVQKKDVTKEQVVELIQKQAAESQPGSLRKGWQVKAAAWVKKMHVDRGDVKVGRLARDGRFEVMPHLMPRYFVPADLDKFELKPYVEVEAPPRAAATSAVAAEATAPS